MPLISAEQFSRDRDLCLRQAEFVGKIISIENGVVRYRLSVDVDIPKASRNRYRNLTFKLLSNTPPLPPNPDDYITGVGIQGLYRDETQLSLARALWRDTYQRLTIDRKTTKLSDLVGRPENPFGELSSVARLGSGTAARIEPDQLPISAERLDLRSPFEEVTSCIGGVQTSKTFALDANFTPLYNSDRGQGLTNYDARIPPRTVIVEPDEQSVFTDIAASGVDPAAITSGQRIIDLLPPGPLAAAAAAVVYVPPSVALPGASFMYQPSFTKVDIDFLVEESLLAESPNLTLDVGFQNFLNAPAREVLRLSVPYNVHRNQFAIPDLAPELTAQFIDKANVSITVKNLEEKATTVKVFRRLISINQHTHDDGTGWEQILSVPLSLNESVTFREQILTDNVVAYRAVGYGVTGRPSQKFAHVLLTPPRDGGTQGRSSLTANARLTGPAGIEISVNDVGNDLTRLDLARYDVTGDSMIEKRRDEGPGMVYVPIAGAPLGSSVKSYTALRGQTLEGKLVFSDTDINPGKLYRYVPIGFDRRGNRFPGDSYLIRAPYSSIPAPVSIDITDPIRTDKGPGLKELSFQMSGELTEFAFNKVQAALSSAGQGQLYDDQIQNNRSQFGQLINFFVQREDTRTGEIVVFGVFEQGEFRDDAVERRVRQIPEPISGHKYIYHVKALLNLSDALFPRVFEREVDPATLQIVKKSLSLLAATRTRTSGIIPSTARQFDATVADSVFQSDSRLDGLTDVSQVREFVFVPEGGGGVRDVSVVLYEDYDFIEWRYSGDLSKVDHFRISLVADGGRLLIGSVPCDPSLSNFCYKRIGPAYGANITYEIKAIGLGYRSMSAIMSEIIPAALALESHRRDTMLLLENAMRGLEGSLFGMGGDIDSDDIQSYLRNRLPIQDL